MISAYDDVVVTSLMYFCRPSTPYVRMTNQILSDRKRRLNGIPQCYHTATQTIYVTIRTPVCAETQLEHG